MLITLSEAVRLDITVVVLASPHETTFGFHHICNHIVNESVLIPDTSLSEFSLVLFFIDYLEDILEVSIVSLKDGVLCREVERNLTINSVFEARVSELFNGLISVVHAHADTTTNGIVENFHDLLLATILRSEDNLESTSFLDLEISSSVLITESVSSFIFVKSSS